MKNKKTIIVAAVVALGAVGVVARSAMVSNANGSADSFASADKNGNGTLDKTEFVAFLKAARLGSASPAANPQKGERVCPRSGKVCEHGGAGGCGGSCEGGAGGCGGSCEGGAGGCGGSCEGGAGGCGGSCEGATEAEEPVVESAAQELK